MEKRRHSWIGILILIVVVLSVPIIYFLPDLSQDRDDPWAFLPEHIHHTDHSSLMNGQYPDGASVTKACLECHAEAADQVMHSAHWTWESDPVKLPGHTEPVVLGKRFAVNNFCIGIRSNWPACTACHAGYGWTDETFDFKKKENIDCLVCHDRSGLYAKTKGGFPAEGVDLVAAAKSVGSPDRANCGGCHFRGGGGNAVKHGDLDESLYFPPDRIDVHMGKHNFVCTDCHQTEKHNIKGRAISVSMVNENQVECTDCHSKTLHEDERINAHIATVACQTCHIPEGAIKEATKMHWDWSQAGQDREEDPHKYLKIKGEFEYKKNFMPEYLWFNGLADHYVLGDKINPEKATNINWPRGDIKDPNAKIWPFKIHRAKQIYDKKYKYLLQPKTYGKDGYWTDFNWDKAVRLGSEVVGLKYSGEYGFTNTNMVWPTTHMVQPKENALSCTDCHSEKGEGRMNWKALGYDGDPMYFGGRKVAQNKTAEVK